MKANELRIGNYYFNDKNQPVQWEVSDFDNYKYEMPDPVPLTEEWKKKLPEQINGYDYELNIERKILVLWPPDGCAAGHCIEIKCEFVHTFQNICFALTGEEPLPI